MFDKLKINKKYLHIGIVTLIIGVILLFVYQLSCYSDDIFFALKNMVLKLLSVLSPILYAFICSYILYRPLLFIERHLKNYWPKLTKKELTSKTYHFVSLLLLVLILIGSIALLIGSIIPPVVENLLTIGERIPEFQTMLTDWLIKVTAHLKNLSISETQIQDITTYLTHLLTDFLTRLFSSKTNMISNVATFFINFFATLILTFYFLKDKDALFKTIDKVGTIIFPSSVKLKIKAFLKDLHEVFGSFIVGQLLDALIVGIASTILLLIIKHPFALLIGVIAGLMNVIPYIGPIIGALLAFILGLFTSFKLGILGALLLMIYQQIDGNFVQPKIVGESIGLAPVWIFIAILVGGNYFGAYGMILAVPIVALLKKYLDRCFVKVEEEQNQPLI